jgi:hypothetical protein
MPIIKAAVKPSLVIGVSEILICENEIDSSSTSFPVMKHAISTI